MNCAKYFVISFCVVSVTLLSGLQWLFRTVGEVDIPYAISRQWSKQSVLYSSALAYGSYDYKANLLQERKPKVIALGSSRAMQLRGEFFESSYVNAGGSVAAARDMERVANEISSSMPLPEVIFIFLDPWWFNHEFNVQRDKNTKDYTRSHFLIDREIVRNGYSAFREHGNWVKLSSGSRNLGIFAIITNDGFDKYGSYHYVRGLAGKQKAWDPEFSDTFSRIKSATSRFEQSNEADEKLMDVACAAINKLSERAHVVLISPPFAPRVWEKMKKGGYNYIVKAESYLTQCAPLATLYSFHDGATLESGDCEFLDGFHGGDVTYARLLLSISEKDAKVRKHVNEKFLHDFIHHYSGFAGGLSSHLLKEGEMDFLNIGCSKSNRLGAN